MSSRKISNLLAIVSFPDTHSELFCFIIQRAATFKAVFHMPNLSCVMQTEFVRHHIVPYENEYSNSVPQPYLTVAALERPELFAN